MPVCRSKFSKIIIVTHEFYPQKSGISTYVQEISKSAWNKGARVEVWAPWHRALETHPFPFTVKPLYLKGTQSWPCRVKLARVFWEQRHHLAGSILYLPEPGPLRTLMYWQLVQGINSKQLVITLHGSEILRFSSPFYRKFLFKKLLQKADKIGVISTFNLHLLGRKFPSLATEPLFTPGALRSDFKKSLPKERKAGDKIILLTVGRIHPRKGQFVIVQALSQLPLTLKHKIEYWLVGPTIHKVYYQKIQKFVINHKIKTKFLGEVDDWALSEIYQKADIFAMTSMPYKKSIEGFGLTYLEASAHRLPIVAHRLGGVVEAVKDNETGLLVEPGNLKELTEAIRKLVVNRVLRQKLGQAGPLWINRFSWDRNVEMLFPSLNRSDD